MAAAAAVDVADADVFGRVSVDLAGDGRIEHDNRHACRQRLERRQPEPSYSERNANTDARE